MITEIGFGHRPTILSVNPPQDQTFASGARVSSELDATRRASRKLLRMVSDLHLRGYQRLRIVPHIAPVGAWRCLIVPVTAISSSNGLVLASNEDYSNFAHYTSADANKYWGWVDAAHCTPGQLAEVFLKHWPELAASGYGPDWVYAGWYQQMLHITHPAEFPVAFSEHVDSTEVLRSTGDLLIPKPPVGMAPDIRPPTA